ncbi:unnamed protein product [Ceratitis capitata]|uniref:(Mediterranean fruit fly) hypothetical protein n=1 Tax=Ceratitis capitata TaxID=7213 RepID=A0A811UNN3_CERCA|nr:unnamed protein product [Ceratitis capitata]
MQGCSEVFVDSMEYPEQAAEGSTLAIWRYHTRHISPEFRFNKPQQNCTINCINTSQQLQWSNQKSFDPQQPDTVPTSAPLNLPHFSTGNTSVIRE